MLEPMLAPRLAPVLGAVLLIACTGTTTTPPRVGEPDAGPAATIDAGPSGPTGPSYHADVRPIFERRCVMCHGPDAIGPVDLEDPAAVKTWAPVIESVVASGQMPPWHAEASCNRYANDRSLSPAERRTILDWAAAGAPLGDPGESRSSTAGAGRGLARIDLELPIEAEHQPVGRDDYHCFAMRWPESRRRFVTGYDVRPSNPAVVHHVNVFVIDPAHAQRYLDRDAAEAGPGYECFGGQFDEGTSLLGSWAPGSLGVEFPDDSGIQVEPGSAVVMEMHFNTDASQAPDRSTLALRLEDSVGKRALVAAFWNFFDWRGDGMRIPAGSTDTVHAFRFDPAPYVPQFAPWLSGDTLRIHAVGLHMHELGQRGRLEIRRYEGARDCLLDIPDWDFSWQGAYFLEQPIDFRLRQDKMYLECQWDNSAAGQPLGPDGRQRTPRDVRWGSGSSDEMCIGFFYITEGD
jgi:mono/diheme cytochrome c family protein